MTSSAVYMLKYDRKMSVKSVKDPITGKISYKEVIIHKDQVNEYFKAK